MIDQNKIFTDKLIDNMLKRSDEKSVFNFFMLKYLNDNKKYEYIDKFNLLPSRVDIEPTTRCFLKCRYCQVPFWNRKDVEDLSFDKFKEILDKLPQLYELKLQGQGEPLLNNDLLEMVKYASEKGIIVRFNTNGMLLTENVCQKIISSDLFELRLSLDGATAETNEVMREGLDFNLVIENIKRLVKMRGDHIFPLINVWTLLTKENEDEMIELIHLCKNIGIDGLKIQTKLSTRDCDSIEEKVLNDTVDTNKSKALFLKLEEEAKNIDLNFEMQFGKWRSKENHCWWLWNSAYISSEGYVVPCCIISNPEKMNFGNIFDNSFESIWNSTQYNELRKNILNLNIHKQCKWCYTK